MTIDPIPQDTDVHDDAASPAVSSDRDVIVAVQGGDRERFVELYDAYIAKIYRYVRSSVYSDADAEDIVSAVWIKAYDTIDRFDTVAQSSFAPWLYRIAYTTMIDRLRHDRHEGAVDTSTLESRLIDAGDTRDQAIEWSQIVAYIATLDQRKQAILRLRIREGLSYDEIATVIEMTPAACRKAFGRIISDARRTIGVVPVIMLLMQMIVR